MPNGLKVFFTVLIVIALIAAVPVMQVLTLTRLTVLNPQFYARPMDEMYDALYGLALGSMIASISYEEDGIIDETLDKLETAIRDTIPPETMSRLMQESLPRILSYVLYDGEAPVIDYGEIVDDVQEGFWDSGVFQDMLADRIRFQVERAGLTGLKLGDIDVELARIVDNLRAMIQFNSYYTEETRQQARKVLFQAYLSAARGDEIDLSELPYPDAVDFMPLGEVVRELPFSSSWDSDAHGDFAMAMADIRYAMDIFRIVLWVGWMGIVVLLVLLLLTWIKRPSVFMNVTGGLLIANGVMALLFALSCWLGGVRFMYLARWGYLDIPVRYADTIRALTDAVIRPFGQIALVTGVLVLVGGITLLILAPIVRKKELAKEQAAA